MGARAQYAVQLYVYPVYPNQVKRPFETPSDAAENAQWGIKKNLPEVRRHFSPPDCLHSSYPLSFLYIFLCCSRNMNVATVCGPSLMKLGTQPLKTQPRPSFAVMRVTRLTIPS
jgi:hypothetical protein